MADLDPYRLEPWNVIHPLDRTETDTDPGRDPHREEAAASPPSALPTPIPNNPVVLPPRTSRAKSERPKNEHPIVPPFFILESALQKMGRQLAAENQAPEAGGLLLGPVGTDNLVLDFVFDEEAVTTRASYTLGTRFLNRVLAEHKSKGMDGKGIVHSHPAGLTHLSAGDLEYAARLFDQYPGLPMFFLPIVEGNNLFSWVVTRSAPSEPVLTSLILI